MEYKCDLCGAPATVHITKIVNGQKIKMHLCQSCAQKNPEICAAGFPPDIIENVKKLEEKLMQSIPPEIKGELASIKCPTCEMTLAEFEKIGRFSCPDCYKAFERKVIEVLAQMHGAIKHIGKTPKSCKDTPPKKKRRKGDATASNQIEFDLGDLGDVFSNDAPQDDEFNKKASEVFKGLGFGGADVIKIDVEVPIPQKEPPQESSDKDKLFALKKSLEKAIADERYEDAAKLRDQINLLENK